MGYHCHLQLWWSLSVDNEVATGSRSHRKTASLQNSYRVVHALCQKLSGNLLSGLAVGTIGYQEDQSIWHVAKFISLTIPGNRVCVTERRKQPRVCCKYLIKRPQEGGIGVLVEVLSSDVGQAVSQQQDEASHRCQTLLPNKQRVFSTLNGENTQTRRCPLQAAAPLTHVPYFYRL